MELHKRVMRTCIFVVIGAILLRLLGNIPGEKIAATLSGPKMASVLLSIGTGRIPSATTRPQHGTAQSSPTEPTQHSFSTVVFSREDIAGISFRNSSGRSVDREALLQMPLQWELTGDAPTVLILHTHATESYKNTEHYTESSSYRTLDRNYNMVSIGAHLAAILEAYGIRVIHDTTLHDNPSYDNSYNNSRATIDRHLAENPSIQMVIDLHRDAIEDSNGNQVGSTVSTPLGESAQMMMVMGSDAGGFPHPDWKENLALAAKLQALLERQASGVCKPINLRSQRYNQDTCSGALLIEMGAAGNTRQEALVAAELLARAIIALSHGCVYA